MSKSFQFSFTFLIFFLGFRGVVSAQIWGEVEIGRDGQPYQMVCVDEQRTLCEYRSVTTTTNPGNASATSAFGQRCEETTQKAVTDCNFEGNSNVQGVMGMAGQLKSTFDQMAAANPQLACSKLAQLSGAASAASGAFNGACSVAYGNCQSACEADLADAQAAGPTGVEAVGAIRANKRQCDTLQRSLAGAVNNIAQFGQVSQTMTFCQSQTGDSFAEYCAKTPTDPFCASNSKATADCSNPTFAATNTVCICQKNPNDPKCGNYNNTNLASKSGSTDGTAGNLSDFGGLEGGFGGGTGFESSALDKPFQAQSGDLNRGGSGGGGGGIGGGGSNSGKGGNPSGGVAGSGLNTKIIGGYGRGGAGSGNGFTGGSGNGSGAPGAMGGGYAVAGKPGVDLKQFLPGGQKDPARGLAGVSGPDGITGPNSSIWQKVKARYYQVSPSLLP